MFRSGPVQSLKNRTVHSTIYLYIRFGLGGRVRLVQKIQIIKLVTTYELRVRCRGRSTHFGVENSKLRFRNYSHIRGRLRSVIIRAVRLRYRYFYCLVHNCCYNGALLLNESAVGNISPHRRLRRRLFHGRRYRLQ